MSVLNEKQHSDYIHEILHRHTYEKIYKITINKIKDFSFANGIERNIQLYIENNYIGRCFSGAYILEFVKLLAYSPIKIIRVDGLGTVYVKFQAKVTQLTMDRFIFSKLKHTETLVVGTMGPIISSLEIPRFAVYSDQLLPVLIKCALHESMKQYIVTVVDHIACDVDYVTYYTDDIVYKPTNEIKELIRSVKTALTKKLSLDVDKVKFFESLMHSYGDVGNLVQTNKESKDVKNILTMLEVEFVPVGYWSRNLNICRSSTLVNFSEKPPKIDTEFVKITFIDIAMIMLINMLNHINLIIDFVYQFDIGDKAHDVIWTYMRSKHLKL